MSHLLQTILVPAFGHVPFEAIAYAKLLSDAYGKPISLLCVDHQLDTELQTLNYPIVFVDGDFDKAVALTVEKQDCVAVVFQHNGGRMGIMQQLKVSRSWRIPYFFIPSGYIPTLPKRVVLPVGFLIEEREKAVWARSLYRYFKSQFTLVKPNDKGTRAAKNVAYIADFLLQQHITFEISESRVSSFSLNKDVLAVFQDSSDLILITASREYGLDDVFFGPQELRVIMKSKLPLMVLNPRDDLYILCGD